MVRERGFQFGERERERKREREGERKKEKERMIERERECGRKRGFRVGTKNKSKYDVVRERERE